MDNEGHKLNDAEKTEWSEERSKTSVSGLNLSRRRLVRGAAVIAPLVLTLRSGALAAASCTGAKVITVFETNGKVSNTTGLVDGDICVTNFNTCPTSPESKIIGGVSDGTFKASSQKCSGTVSSGPVAILSSQSATSLFNPAG